MKTLAEQITAVRREIAMRKNVYPRRVGDGKMRRAEATHETECMEAVLDTLTRLQDASPPAAIKSPAKPDAYNKSILTRLQEGSADEGK